MTQIATWVNGTRVKTDATDALKEFERIAAKHGEATAAAVVEESRPEEATLHSEFIWDDQEAARIQREQRATELSRCLKVTHIDGSGKEHESRKFVVEKRHNAPNVFTPIEDVLADPGRRAAMLQDALNELMRWRRKYRSLNELAAVFRAYEETLEAVEV